MNVQSVNVPALPPARFGLTIRLVLIVVVFAIETVLISFLNRRLHFDLDLGPVSVLRDMQRWLFRFIIVYGILLALLVYLRGDGTIKAIAFSSNNNLLARIIWGAIHLTLFMTLAVLSAGLYGRALSQPFAVVAIEWHICALAAIFALFCAAAPLSAWRQTLSGTGALPFYAVVPAIVSVLAIRVSQELWRPTAQVTFRLVELVLKPLIPSLHGNIATMTLATDRFAVTISDICSGLEGVGLILVFCTTWLWIFRREYLFPRALLIAPIAVILIFSLNVGRIAALVLIGNAGYERVAEVGFHSQAGWIAFNFAAVAVAILARLNPWWRSQPLQSQIFTENAVAPYLMPLLSILAAGMVAHALSEGFDFFYPLRLIGAALVLVIYRRRYTVIDWTFSWRAPVVGVAIFCIWVAFAHFTTSISSIPHELSSLPAPTRVTWILCRVLAATITVPIAEELAYRGFLLRRFVRADFESVTFNEVRWSALALSAIAFGVTHGRLWLPGILAGLGYGLIAVKTRKLGEAVVAHATTNGLLAIYVLSFEKWQFW